MYAEKKTCSRALGCAGATFQEHVSHFSDNDVNNLAEDLLPVVKQLQAGSSAHRSIERTGASVSKVSQEHAEPTRKPEAVGAAANGHSEHSGAFSTAPQSPAASMPSEEVCPPFLPSSHLLLVVPCMPATMRPSPHNQTFAFLHSA